MKTTTQTRYLYLENMIDDVKEYIKENNIDINEKSEEDLYEDLFCEDSITWNWTFDWYPNFEEFMVDWNLDLFFQAMYDFWYDNINEAIKDYKNRWWYDEKIYIDSTIRCSLLWQAIHEAYEELQK